MMFPTVPLAPSIGMLVCVTTSSSKGRTLLRTKMPRRKHKGAQTLTTPLTKRATRLIDNATQHGSDLKSFLSNLSLLATSRTDEKRETRAPEVVRYWPHVVGLQKLLSAARDHAEASTLLLPPLAKCADVARATIQCLRISGCWFREGG
jgi:hypothetical protein